MGSRKQYVAGTHAAGLPSQDLHLRLPSQLDTKDSDSPSRQQIRSPSLSQEFSNASLALRDFHLRSFFRSSPTSLCDPPKHELEGSQPRVYQRTRNCGQNLALSVISESDKVAPPKDCPLPSDKAAAEFCRKHCPWVLAFIAYPDKNKTFPTKGLVTPDLLARLNALQEWYCPPTVSRRNSTQSQARRGRSATPATEQADDALGFPSTWPALPEGAKTPIQTLDAHTRIWSDRPGFLAWKSLWLKSQSTPANKRQSVAAESSVPSPVREEPE